MLRQAPIICLLLLACTSSAGARAVWRFRTFTTRDGLAHNVVRDILEDRQGVLWIATMGGLDRYDPGRCLIEHVPLGRLARQEVMALAEAPDGTLWVGTQGGGVGRLRGRTWTWFTRREGLPSDEITWLLVDRRGRIWATPTGGGLALFEGTGWRRFSEKDGLSPGEIGRCAELRDGTILCGTYERPLLQRFENGRFGQISVEAATSRHFYVHTLLETPDRQLWLATKGAGVLQGRREGAGYRWVVHDTSNGLAGNRAGALRLAADGGLWVATTAGASRWDGQRWQTFTRGEGLGSNQIFAVRQARDGAVWFGSLGGGATRYAPSRWEQFGEREGLPSEHLTGGLELEQDGTIWAGTDEGVARLRGGSWTVYRTGKHGRDHITHLLRTSRGELWVATRDGLRRRRGDELEDVDGAPYRQVNRLAEDRSGRLWQAAAGGVAVLEGGRWIPRGAGLPSVRVNDLSVDRGGRIWAATDNGLARLEGERWISYLASATATRMSRINSLALDRSGQLWASGLEGIHRMGEGGWEPLAPGPWLPAGLYSRFVMSTSEGSLWFAVRGLGVRRLRDGVWTAFTSRDGLASDTVTDVEVADGNLLFATLGGGLGRYQPDHHAPETRLGASEGDQPAGVPSRVVQGEAAVIPFRGADVLKDTEAADLLYSWRVDGGLWSSFASGTRAILPGLGAGPHVFEVRAMDQDMNVDATPARHRFEVVRPWWAEPWLIAVVALAAILALLAATRTVRAVARERAAVQKEQAAVDQRREFVRLASHELRKPLARMAHRAEMLGQPGALADQSKRAEYAGAIADDSRRLARLVETLLDQARVQDGLRLELRTGDLRELALAVLRDLTGEPGAAAVRVESAEVALPVDHDAFLLALAVRNLIDNALKYAGQAGPVEVRSERAGSFAHIVISDQGPGIPADERERIFEPFFRGRGRGSGVSGFGLGLAFARDIARAHGGELTLEPSTVGATFRLRLPLHVDNRHSPLTSS